MRAGSMILLGALLAAVGWLGWSLSDANYEIYKLDRRVAALEARP